MAEEQMGAAENEVRTYWAWTELFRTFQVALDPKKLLLAAAGIVAMYAGWWVLAVASSGLRAEPVQSRQDELKQKYISKGLADDQATERARHDYAAEVADYR